MYILYMDFNHDFNGENQFLLSGVEHRLQMVKTAILCFGDMGYTDPELPDVREFIGEYTDEAASQELEAAVRTILVDSMIVAPQEITYITVVRNTGAGAFTVRLGFVFGTTEILLDMQNPVV